MNIEVKKMNDLFCVTLSGSLDADTVGDFRARTAELFDKGAARFVFDMTGVKFADSVGLGAVIALRNRCRAQKGDVKVFGVTGELKETFEVTRLTKVFDICADLSDAISKFKISVKK
jgi:anti-sigma B factor antagonist